jgi:hypothetical protein
VDILRRRRTAVVALVLAAALAGSLAACDSGPANTTGGPTTGATGGTTGTTTGGATTTPPATTVGPTTGTTTGPLTTPHVSPDVPDPRSVPVQSLLRPGTRVLKAMYGDVDGDGVEDIVLASIETSPPPGAVMAQAYLDVYRYDGEGGWPRAWEASAPAPPGNPQAPDSVLEKAEPGAVSQQLDFLALVDFRGDGSSELVVGVLNVGAGPGPLDVWAVRFGPEGAVNDFWEQTTQGGVLVAAGDTVKLQTPSFEDGDPACCPSSIEHQTIGYAKAADRIKVLERTFTPVG